MSDLKKWAAEGAMIIFDPTPGGVPHEGGRSFSLRIPALQVTEMVADREKVAGQIAEALNADDAKDAAIASLREILRECEEFFDNRADAEYFPDSAAPHPNKEMVLLTLIREAIGKAGA